MTRRQRRIALVFGGLALLAVAVGLILTALSQNIVFFLSPSDVVARTAAVEDGRSFRLGGLVEPGSVHKSPEQTVFAITDGNASVQVSTQEALPDLFAEGKGVIVQGTLNPDRTFHATDVLAKHDENYMPAEVVEALKKQGKWRDDEASASAQP